MTQLHHSLLQDVQPHPSGSPLAGPRPSSSNKQKAESMCVEAAPCTECSEQYLANVRETTSSADEAQCVLYRDISAACCADIATATPQILSAFQHKGAAAMYFDVPLSSIAALTIQ